MSLTFYFAPMSTAGITDLVFAELGTPHERVTVDIRAGGTKTPDFLKVNPNGKVPVIVHEGVTIFESAAITMYLGETFGVEKKLYPAPGPKRGDAMKWIVWTNVSLGDAVGRWARNTFDWVPKEQHNAKAAEAARKDIDDCLKVLDQSLDGKQFLGGADYTLADTHVFSFTGWLRHMKVDFAPFKNVEAWSARVMARPAVAKAMAAMAG